MSTNLEIILVGIIACFACAIPGVFLVLRGMSMMTDAISHTVLLGITIGFFIANDLNSPLLIIFAIIVGLITVWLTELLHQTNLLSKDSAIGIVFPLFFSSAVILISKFAKNVHLDVEHVVFGEMAFIPFDRFETENYDFGPKALIILLIIFIVNLIIVLLFYKELKISTLDYDYARIIGFSPIFLNYLLMSMVSVTSVGTFQSIGVILVISFMTGPALTARLLTDKLSIMIIYSLLIGSISSVVGYFLAIYFDVSISGMQATIIGVVFLITLLISPKKGILKSKLYKL
ncbi:metal ABC transporter permease [Gemelliphila palaticanis]|uniref:Metal ABC transporter permease n=1 Tax=Gemelliphila palaticanis TaxID=81950 RepID=A0ABX2T2H1_9BACL|nr:metal ABC transporter permease [Gemella palaticanis]MBF0715480.1 metal ABC transporter permease [Gemella palaticanis]NYS47410.1 metal ABC transporter permease [Gemella palaticanis]